MMAKALLVRNVLRTRRELDVGRGAWAACVALLGRVAWLDMAGSLSALA
jgi:hypothetical protein